MGWGECGLGLNHLIPSPEWDDLNPCHSRGRIILPASKLWKQGISKGCAARGVL